MTADERILRAVETLHLDFVKEPTERKSQHISDFIYGWTTVEGKFISGCYGDTTPETLHKMLAYDWSVRRTRHSNFSPKNIAHLKSVAEEIFKEIAA